MCTCAEDLAPRRRRRHVRLRLGSDRKLESPLSFPLFSREYTTFGPRSKTTSSLWISSLPLRLFARSSKLSLRDNAVIDRFLCRSWSSCFNSMVGTCGSPDADGPLISSTVLFLRIPCESQIFSIFCDRREQKIKKICDLEEKFAILE
jgi:hypothetical protein